MIDRNVSKLFDFTRAFFFFVLFYVAAGFLVWHIFLGWDGIRIFIVSSAYFAWKLAKPGVK